MPSLHEVTGGGIIGDIYMNTLFTIYYYWLETINSKCLAPSRQEVIIFSNYDKINW